MTGEAGGHRPLVQASGTDTAGIESVPVMATLADPAVVGRGRPVTFRATDMRSGWTPAGNFLNLGNRIGSNG